MARLRLFAREMPLKTYEAEEVFVMAHIYRDGKQHSLAREGEQSNDHAAGKGGSGTTGRVPNPMTPIPPRASAFPHQRVRVRPRYTQIVPRQEDITRIPTLPPPSAIWKYESAEYEAESSLGSLSLVVPPAIDELDTHPTPFLQEEAVAIDELDTLPFRDMVMSPSIDELDTLPEHFLPAIDEFDTQPPSIDRAARTLALRDPLYIQDEDTAALLEADTVPPPGTAQHFVRSIKNSSSISSSSERERSLQQSAKSRSAGNRGASFFKPVFTPLDRLRWWLLSPGRLELLVYTGGVILLLLGTCLLVLAVLFSVGALNNAHSSLSHHSFLTASLSPSALWLIQ